MITEICTKNALVDAEFNRLTSTGCLVELSNTKVLWLNVKATCLAHEDALARKEQFRRWNNCITLVLAVLTALSAVLLPFAKDDNSKMIWMIWGLTVPMAILTSISTVVEQTFARPEDISNHAKAIIHLQSHVAKLNVSLGNIKDYAFETGDVDIPKTLDEVQALGKTIEELQISNTVSINADKKKRAAAEFRETPMGKIIDKATDWLQKKSQELLSNYGTAKRVGWDIKALH